MGAVKNFESTPPDAAALYWIDGFSIDEHQGFYGDKGEDNSEQGRTFGGSAETGNTVTVLAPGTTVSNADVVPSGEQLSVHRTYCARHMPSTLARLYSRPATVVKSNWCPPVVPTAILHALVVRRAARARCFAIVCALGVGDVLHRGHRVRLHVCLARWSSSRWRWLTTARPPGRFREHRREDPRPA